MRPSYPDFLISSILKILTDGFSNYAYLQSSSHNTFREIQLRTAPSNCAFVRRDEKADIHSTTQSTQPADAECATPNGKVLPARVPANRITYQSATRAHGTRQHRGECVCSALRFRAFVFRKQMAQQLRNLRNAQVLQL